MKPSPDFVFPVALSWAGGKRVLAHVQGKDAIEIATPPEFDSGIVGVWSPEDFLVAAVASCYAVTLVAIAGRSRVPLHGLQVDAIGHVGSRDAAGLAILGVSLEVRIDTDESHVANAHKAAGRAERYCLVSAALAVPVDLHLTVRATEVAA